MKTAPKLDLYQKHKAEYVAPRAPALVDVQPASYLTITGRGEPGGSRFQSKIGSLYSMAFTIKMARKFAGRDYTVCKLEGLYWTGRTGSDFATVPASQWNWRLLIRVPPFIQPKDLAAAVAALEARGKGLGVSEVRLEEIDEGKCVQLLHVGPYSRTAESVAKMRRFVDEQGLSIHGLHHEIYLSDPRRVAESRLRTILRQPVR